MSRVTYFGKQKQEAFVLSIAGIMMGLAIRDYITHHTPLGESMRYLFIFGFILFIFSKKIAKAVPELF